MQITGKWKKVAVAAAAAVILGTAGAGAVTAVSGDANGSGRSGSRAGSASPTESVFVSIVPCRIFSSVPVGGKFDPGETRSINKGGNLSSQGGNPAGCGIPNAATALHVNITAPLAEGNGFIRVWPDESVEQGATFMNFSNAFNVSNAGTVDVDKGATDVMDLKVYNSRTHVIIDVMGYYVEELFASVNGDGTVARGNGVVSAARLAAGQYEVIFDRNVTGCGYEASIDNGSGQGEIVVDLRSTDDNGVFVQTHSSTGADVDKAFYVTVDC